MSDPTEISVPTDEAVEIITQEDAESGLPYLVEVRDNPVRISHVKSTVDRGAQLSQGQTHTLQNLRGEPIYVSAVDGTGTAKLRVNPAGADIKSQPPKGVTVEGDVSLGSNVDVEDRSGRELGKTRIEDSGGVLIDPLSESNLGPYHSRETTAGTYASINPGSDGASVVIVADTSGSATLTVEVSQNGTDWSAYTLSIADSSGLKETLGGFAYVRCKVDQNLNSVEISAKGV
jgi:hypothetical protein